jgi:2-keto-4-pentenoate hydratase
VSKPTLVCGHLPFKPSMDNSHQAFKAGEIVLPGSMTPIYPVGAADRVEAEFDTLGSGSVRFA